MTELNQTQSNIQINPTQRQQIIKSPLYVVNGLGLIASVLLLAFNYIPNYSEFFASTVLTASFGLFSLLGIFFTYRNRLQIASNITVIGILYLAVFVALNFGGLNNPSALILFLVPLPFISVYNNRASLYIYGVIVETAFLMAFIGGNVGFMTLDALDFDDLFIVALAFASIVIMLDFFGQQLLNSLKISNTNAKLLEERNADLLKIQENQEKIIEERTSVLTRRSQYLETTAAIGRDTSSILNPDQLLQQVVNQIANRFEFYHVGIFLNDEQNQWSVLRAASSTGGKKMIARQHRLEVGKRGIVGYVTGIGQPRISQNIGLDFVHTNAEELPDTRSEMALPLKAYGRIIGALDIQASIQNAFDEEDIKTLQILADQIALALRNAQLYQQAQVSVEEVRRASGESSRRAWQEAQLSGRLPTYRFTKGPDNNTSRIVTGALPQITDEKKVSVPIQVRGQSIGTIDILRDDLEAWNESETELLQTLSDQLGVALDSARLFDETQQRAANEQLISEITTTIRESLDMETILKNAADKMHNTLELPQVTIRLTDSSINPSSNGRDHS